MTEAVAGCTLQQNRVFQCALAGSTFKDDILNAISDAQDLSTEIFHRRCEQQATDDLQRQVKEAEENYQLYAKNADRNDVGFVRPS
jgi:hypothetical protein